MFSIPPPIFALDILQVNLLLLQAVIRYESGITRLQTDRNAGWSLEVILRRQRGGERRGTINISGRTGFLKRTGKCRNNHNNFGIQVKDFDGLELMDEAKKQSSPSHAKTAIAVGVTAAKERQAQEERVVRRSEELW